MAFCPVVNIDNLEKCRGMVEHCLGVGIMAHELDHSIELKLFHTGNADTMLMSVAKLSNQKSKMESCMSPERWESDTAEDVNAEWPWPAIMLGGHRICRVRTSDAKVQSGASRSLVRLFICH